MPVYVDSARNGFGRMVLCHMIADTPAELHAMALLIGMRREWYQSPATASFPHYDVSLSRRKIALANGAREIERQELAAHMKRVRKELITAGQTWLSSGWLE
jgi:Protein of unknown function (DUF4031)